MRLLHLIASPRGEQSRTLSISKEFISTLKKERPDLIVEELDLFNADLPSVNLDLANAKYTLMGGGTLDETTRASWERISGHANHFLSHDIFVLSSPMWNYSIPYVLKHYIDVIMQAGILFQFTRNGAEGLAKDKKMICITSRGSDYGPDSPLNDLDYVETYLRSIFGLAGIRDMHFINAQPLDFAPGVTYAMLEAAKLDARRLAQNLEISTSV